MPGTITVAPHPEATPPRVDLTVTWTGAVNVAVHRNDPDGVARPVRDADPVTLTDGVWTGSDYESWFDVEHTWQVFGDDSTRATSTPGRLTPELPWLRHTAIPSRSVPVDLVSQAAPTTTLARSVLAPIGRHTPIVISDGTRRAPSTSYGVRTWSLEEGAALTALLADGAVLLLDVPVGWRWGVTHEYLAIGDVTQTRLWEEWAPFEGRMWELPADLVDRPTGSLVTGRTYLTAATGYTSYAAWADKYPTYGHLLTGVV